MNDGDVLRERMRGGTSPILPSTLPVPFGAPVSCCLSPFYLVNSLFSVFKIHGAVAGLGAFVAAFCVPGRISACSAGVVNSQGRWWGPCYGMDFLSVACSMVYRMKDWPLRPAGTDQLTNILPCEVC